MNINLQILNKEDIQYIKNVSENKQEDILRTAISIGLKSIQMSEVRMDCHSYIDPIREIITESSIENKDKINNIDEKLDTLLNIKTNSSRKGRLSENLCYRQLIINYPNWEFIDVTQVGHEGDCRAKNTPIGEILYEFKSYDTNINKDQINKFYEDLENTGIKYGIFVSNTSGIVGKKNLEWEMIQGDKLVIYISNVGLNGMGCILATKLLLALVDNNIMEKDKKWLIQEDYDKNEIYRNLVDLFDEYQKDNESIIKFRKHIKNYREKMNVMIDLLDRDIYQIVLNTENTYNKMLGLINQIKNKSKITKIFNFEEFLKKINKIDKYEKIYIQLYKIIENNKELEINLQDNEWLIIKDNEIIAKTKTMNSKIQLIIIRYSKDKFQLNPLYEEFKDKKILIELNDNYKIWEIIQFRFKII